MKRRKPNALGLFLILAIVALFVAFVVGFAGYSLFSGAVR